jgi:hypothetical protein
MRSNFEAHVLDNGLCQCDIWSDAEFEELLGRDAESLLKRFIEGEAFRRFPMRRRSSFAGYFIRTPFMAFSKATLCETCRGSVTTLR